jgi:gliding motility-associated-like protein
VICNSATINIGQNGWAVINADALATASSDNCGNSALDIFTVVDSINIVGDSTIWVYVQDAAGNIDSCQATVTITDLNPPVAICQNTTIYLDASGSASIVAADIDGGSTDNGTIASTTASQTNFDCTNTGVNSIWLYVTDDGGNIDSCQATVTVLDTIAPVAVCQNITVALDGSGNATITAAQIDGGSSDNCAGFTLSASQTSFDCSMTGANTVTLTVTDASGNVSTCNATVTIVDNTIPTVICNSATINIGQNGWAVINADALATASSDNCGNSALDIFTVVDSINIVGDSTIWVYVQDAAGNIDSCQATVTITDLNPPVANCQNTTIYLDGSGNASIVPADIDGGSTDNGTIVSTTASQTDFDCTNTGANSVWLYVTDDGGNMDSCQATVTVLDTIAPAVACQDFTVYLDASGVAQVQSTDILVMSTDNCAPLVSAISATQFTNIGNYPVTVTVTDPSGNSSTCASIITVLDTIVPQVNCLAFTGVILHLDSNGQAVLDPAQLDGGSSDNDTIVALTASQVQFDCGDIGNNNVTLYVADAAGNMDSCVAVVTVLDTIAPSVICQNITIALDGSGNATISSAQLDNGSSDNCTLASTSASQTTFDCSAVGVNVVTLTAIDASGNTSSCNALVTVIDTIMPVAVCNNITIYLDGSGVATIIGQDIDGGSTDNCGTLTYTASETSFDSVGVYTVILTVTDGSGNSSSCTATVTVNDIVAPEAICQPATIYLDGNGNASITPADIDGGSTDNGTIVGITASQTAFTCNDLGINDVILTVTDDGGNNDSCIAVVTVLDTIAPSVVCNNITIYLDGSGVALISGQDIDGGSTDNCGTLTYTSSDTSFDNVGTYTVILTVTDGSGNSSTCTATVTVNDISLPTANCQPVTIYLDGSGNAGITAADIDGGSTDNGTIVGLTASQTAFDCSDLGTNDVILTVTDDGGNTDSCIAVVTVLDTIAPNAVCNNITIYVDGSGAAVITGQDIDGGSTDNCGTLTYTASQTSFADVGTYTVTLTVTDASGNTSSCTATVDVLLVNLPPIAVDDSVSTGENEVVVIGNEANDSDPNNDPFTTTDATAGVGSVEINGDGTLTYTPATGWCGTDTVQYTICDSAGLCDAAIILITVECDDDLVIPHGFSPNGDGISDTWVIQGLENYPDNSVKLFNRWGAEIYNAAPYGNEWDGRSTAPMTINGQLPAGTYFFILDLGNGTVETGDLYLSN